MGFGRIDWANGVASATAHAAWILGPTDRICKAQGGDKPGEGITLGFRESADVVAAQGLGFGVGCRDGESG